MDLDSKKIIEQLFFKISGPFTVLIMAPSVLPPKGFAGFRM